MERADTTSPESDAGRSSREWVDVAFIRAPHGIKGEVRVELLTDFPERYTRGWTVRLSPGRGGGDGRMARVRLRAIHGGEGIMQIEGVLSRDQAESLRSWRVQIPADQVHPLPEGQYYPFQLVGMRVTTVGGRELGELVEVLRLPANDVYVIRGQSGGELLLPALRSVVREVELASRRMLVELPPGLLEEG